MAQKNLLLFKSKTVLPIFENFKIYFKKINFEFSFFDCSLMYKEGFCKFPKKY